MQVKHQFPIFTYHPDLVWLDSASSTQKPDQVIRAEAQFYQQGYANIHRGLYPLSEQATADFEASRDAVRQFINAAEREEIIFTSGTTHALNLVAHGLGQCLQAGDAVLITEMEHHANIVPWHLLAHRGVVTKALKLADDGSLCLEVLEQQLTADVKVVSLTAVSNALGSVNPVKEIIQRIRAVRPDMIIVIDAAQAIAHMPIDVQAWDCDFLAFSAHKMYGPTGVGVLYGKRARLEVIPPYMGGGDMIRTVTLTHTTFNQIPYKFEAGTPNIAGVIAFSQAIEFVKSLGWSALQAHEQVLLRQATQALLAIDGVRIIGQAAHKEAVISFVIDGLHPADVATLLGHEQVCLRASHHCAQPVMQRFAVPATLRASFAAYNSVQDIDRLVAAVEMAIQMLR